MTVAQDMWSVAALGRAFADLRKELRIAFRNQPGKIFNHDLRTLQQLRQWRTNRAIQIVIRSPLQFLTVLQCRHPRAGSEHTAASRSCCALVNFLHNLGRHARIRQKRSQFFRTRLLGRESPPMLHR